MKTLAKQMIVERAKRLYGRMDRTLGLYKQNLIPEELVFEREERYRNQFKGYLQSMNDLELITSQEYIDYFNIYCSDVDKIVEKQRIDKSHTKVVYEITEREKQFTDKCYAKTGKVI